MNHEPIEYNVFSRYEHAKAGRYHVKETIALPDSKDCGLFDVGYELHPTSNN